MGTRSKKPNTDTTSHINDLKKATFLFVLRHPTTTCNLARACGETADEFCADCEANPAILNQIIKRSSFSPDYLKLTTVCFSSNGPGNREFREFVARHRYFLTVMHISAISNRVGKSNGPKSNKDPPAAIHRNAPVPNDVGDGGIDQPFSPAAIIAHPQRNVPPESVALKD